MKIKSVKTEELTKSGRIVGTSTYTYHAGKEPECPSENDLFDVMETAISSHKEIGTSPELSRFLITISTTAGKFIKTYKPGEESDS